MTEYKGIKGGKVQNYDTDPGTPYVGQVWYNQNLGDLRVRKTYIGSAWSTGGSLNTARRVGGSAGVQTAALAFGGYIGPANSGLNESYNGSTWTEVADLTTARRGMNVGGIQTSAIAAGGYTTTNVAQLKLGTDLRGQKLEI